MKDFYTELKLSPGSSLQEIQIELLRLEQLWHRREITSPEKATEKLALINQAKKVFTSSSSKAAYDRELENSRKKPVPSDPKAERYNQYKKWHNQAVEYSERKQWDLAKAVIEKAFSFIDPDSEEPWFYNDAATIYRETRDYSSALSYINKALVLDESVADFYITKGLVYSAQYEDRDTFQKDRDLLLQKEYAMFKTAATKAKENNDNHSLAIAYGLLAYSYARGLQGREEQLAKQLESEKEKTAAFYASESIKLGDPWGSSKRIIDSINRIQQERTAIDNERKRKATEFEAWKSQDIFDAFSDAENKDQKQQADEHLFSIRESDAYNKLDFDEEILQEAKILFAKIRTQLVADIKSGKTSGSFSLVSGNTEWARRNPFGSGFSFAGVIGIPISKDNPSLKQYKAICKRYPKDVFQGGLSGDYDYGKDGQLYLEIITVSHRENLCFRSSLTKWGIMLFNE